MTNRRGIQLSGIYETTAQMGPEKTYDDWAADYGSAVAAAGYRLPALAAGFLARHLPRDAAPILDAGAGTGLVGDCLKVLGFRRITGIDISARMLEQAQRTGAYERTSRRDLSQPLSLPAGHFAAALCIGCFGPGHAPPAALDHLLEVVRPGGLIVFNVVEATWRAQGFADRIDRFARAATWTVTEDSGPFDVYSGGPESTLARLFVCRKG